MQAFWNQRYSEPAYAYGTAPNDFLAQELAQLPAGRLLLPAEGEGRNAVWAARQGWTVKALDYSEAGQRKALDLAQRAQVTIDYDVVDLSEVRLEQEQFDAIGLVFVHLPPAVRQHLHREVVQALRPGGHLIMEAFAPGQLGRRSGGPQDLALLYDENLLRADFQELECLQIETRLRHLDEGPFHQGEASVVQLRMRKRMAD